MAAPQSAAILLLSPSSCICRSPSRTRLLASPYLMLHNQKIRGVIDAVPARTC